MDFLMPKLSDTMEEGTVLQWLVADGATVNQGDEIVEIETDKANMMVAAPASGTLQIAVQVGETRPIGAPIAVIGEGAAPEAVPVETPAAEAAEQVQPVPVPIPAVGSVPASTTDERATGGIPTADDGTGDSIGLEISAPDAYPGSIDVDDLAPQPPTTTADPVAAPTPPSPGDHVKASPLARRLAEERGVDLAQVTGTGPAGRIVRDDVEAAAVTPADVPAVPVTPPAPAATDTSPSSVPPVPTGTGERTPLTRLQSTVAKRMAISKPGAPHFYLERDLDVTALLVLRKELVAASPEGEGPSVNDMIVRAVALASAAMPQALRRFDGDALVAPDGVHVGVAVAIPNGLLVPVVRNADTKRIADIASEVRDLVARSRDGSITPPELEGSSVSVSNLGMFGVDRFAAVLNPPEPAILAVGRATPKPVVVDGAVVVRDVMTVTLSVDHRALYGADAAQYLAAIAEYLERPGSLVL